MQVRIWDMAFPASRVHQLLAPPIPNDKSVLAFRYTFEEADKCTLSDDRDQCFVQNHGRDHLTANAEMVRQLKTLHTTAGCKSFVWIQTG